MEFLVQIHALLFYNFSFKVTGRTRALPYQLAYHILSQIKAVFFFFIHWNALGQDPAELWPAELWPNTGETQVISG